VLNAAFVLLERLAGVSGKRLPVNKEVDGQPLLRDLDCAVVEALHQYRKEEGMPAYDSVRGMFAEGSELYPGAGFRAQNHIQLCIRNPNCIKGYFRVRALDNAYPAP
jgi:hypothetical protein